MRSAFTSWTEEDRALIDRWMADEATVEEQARAQALLADGDTPTAFRKALHAGEAPVDTADVQRLWQGIAATMGGEQNAASAWRRPRSAKLVSRTLVTVAAMALVIMLGARVFSRWTPPSQATARWYTTSAAQVLPLTLRDGSRVTLAPHSQLVVEEDFGAHQRSVRVNGEAYFDVADAPTPFLVRTGRIVTRVLGTAFDVRHEADGAVRIIVVRGKVETRSPATPVILTRGMEGHFTDSTVIVHAGIDTTPYTAWTHEQLVFTEISVAAMLSELGRWYGYRFRIADTMLATQPVTATFDMRRRRETLGEIERLLDVTMTFDDSVVTLRRRSQFTGPVRRVPLPSSSTIGEVGK